MADNEILNENDLNEEVLDEIDDAEVMTVPIDDTLSISGEAADAKAVGDALALKADKSELQNKVNVNGIEPDNQGLILVTAEDIELDDSGEAQSIAEAIEEIEGKTAADIPMSDVPGAGSIAEAIEGIGDKTAADISMGGDDQRTVAEAIGEAESGLEELEEVVSGLDTKTAENIPMNDSVGAPTIAEKIASVEAGMVRSVNDELPDEDGNVEIRKVDYAENLASDDMEQVDGAFLRRTTGGSGSLQDGNAWALRLLGNSVHDNFTPEELTMTVIPIPRTTPAAITASLDEETFEEYVVEAGTYTLTYVVDEWDADPDDYGLTIANDPVDGDVISIYWDGENDAVVSIIPAPRVAPAPITATIDRDVFVGVVTQSGTTLLVYATGWSEDPADYGITVTGEPVAGDQIRVVYVKEIRGTIRTAAPTRLVATGWNLYEAAEGYARVIRYADSYGYKIGGTYTAIMFAETPEGEQSAITPDAGGLFQVPGDGYVIVDGGGADTYILTTWSDWTAGYEGEFQAYSESSVALGAIIEGCFPYGLGRIGDVRDEIDVNDKKAIRRIRRMAYTAENLAAAKASGMAYEYDEDYIYIVMADPQITTITISEEYAVCEHGMEFFDGTDIQVYAEILYGTNLKDKLRRQVITKLMTVNEVKGMS